MAKKRRSGLGRGLGAILSESNLQQPDSVNEIPLSQIETNPFQPRNEFDETALQELSDSIRVQGIIQPITVRKLSDKQYQLIAGERRLRASKMAGLRVIPAYIRTANDEQMLQMALIENIQRKDLNPIEISLSYKRLVDELKLKQDELGGKVGKSRETISHYLRLLKLPPEIQAGLRDAKISMGHAKTLIPMGDPVSQLGAFRRILDDQLSVRQTEALIRTMNKAKNGKSDKGSKSGLSGPEQLQLKKIQDELEEKFGNKVQLSQNAAGKGDIRISFNSTEDLNRILEILEI